MTQPPDKKVGYWGDTKKGKQQGKGTQIYPNGDVYQGDWMEGKIQGKGIYAYSNGSKYVGDFDDQLRHGQGSFQYLNGDIYNGQWYMGKRTGNGIMYYGGTDASETYTGEFRENKRTGVGVYLYPNGDVYSGAWHNDQKHGKGKLKYATDQSSFDGNWEYDSPHGKGSYTASDGREFSGLLCNGKFVNVDIALELRSHLSFLEQTRPPEFYAAPSKPRSRSCSAVVPHFGSDSHKTTSPVDNEQLNPVLSDPTIKCVMAARQFLKTCKCSFGVAIADFEKLGRPYLRVIQVKPESPASLFGLRRGDTILALCSTPVSTKSEFLSISDSISPGTYSKLTVDKEGHGRIERDIYSATTIPKSDFQFLKNVSRGLWTGGEEEISKVYSKLVHQPTIPECWVCGLSDRRKSL